MSNKEPPKSEDITSNEDDTQQIKPPLLRRKTRVEKIVEGVTAGAAALARVFTKTPEQIELEQKQENERANIEKIAILLKIMKIRNLKYTHIHILNDIYQDMELYSQHQTFRGIEDAANIKIFQDCFHIARDLLVLEGEIGTLSEKSVNDKELRQKKDELKNLEMQFNEKIKNIEISVKVYLEDLIQNVKDNEKFSKMHEILQGIKAKVRAWSLPPETFLFDLDLIVSDLFKNVKNKILKADADDEANDNVINGNVIRERYISIFNAVFFDNIDHLNIDKFINEYFPVPGSNPHETEENKKFINILMFNADIQNKIINKIQYYANSDKKNDKEKLNEIKKLLFAGSCDLLKGLIKENQRRGKGNEIIPLGLLDDQNPNSPVFGFLIAAARTDHEFALALKQYYPKPISDDYWISIFKGHPKPVAEEVLQYPADFVKDEGTKLEDDEEDEANEAKRLAELRAAVGVKAEFKPVAEAEFKSVAEERKSEEEQIKAQTQERKPSIEERKANADTGGFLPQIKPARRVSTPARSPKASNFELTPDEYQRMREAKSDREWAQTKKAVARERINQQTQAIEPLPLIWSKSKQQVAKQHPEQQPTQKHTAPQHPAPQHPAQKHPTLQHAVQQQTAVDYSKQSKVRRTSDPILPPLRDDKKPKPKSSDKSTHGPGAHH